MPDDRPVSDLRRRPRRMLRHLRLTLLRHRAPASSPPPPQPLYSLQTLDPPPQHVFLTFPHTFFTVKRHGVPGAHLKDFSLRVTVFSLILKFPK